MIQDINTEEFEGEVIGSEIPVLVDFWAPWCGPCRALGPTLEQLAEEYDGEVKIVKVNIDDNPALASRFGIRSIPYMILFKNGQPAETLTGAKSKSVIEAMFNKHL